MTRFDLATLMGLVSLEQHGMWYTYRFHTVYFELRAESQTEAEERVAEQFFTRLGEAMELVDTIERQ